MDKNTTDEGSATSFDWIDAQQVMEMLNIKPETLKDWRRRGVISYSSLVPGGKLFYNKSEITLLLEQNSKRKK